MNSDILSVHVRAFLCMHDRMYVKVCVCVCVCVRVYMFVILFFYYFDVHYKNCPLAVFLYSKLQRDEKGVFYHNFYPKHTLK